jgi:hypothetical protein
MPAARIARLAVGRGAELQIAHLAGQRIGLDHRRRRWRHHVNLRSVAVLNDDDEAGRREAMGQHSTPEARDGRGHFRCLARSMTSRID